MVRIAIFEECTKDAILLEKMVVDYFTQKNYLFHLDIFTTIDGLKTCKEIYSFAFCKIPAEEMNLIKIGELLRVNNPNMKMICLGDCLCFHSIEVFQSVLNRLHPFAYLQKPVNTEDIVKQLDDIVFFLDLEETQTQMEFYHVRNCGSGEKSWLKSIHLPLEQIYYLEYKKGVRRIGIYMAVKDRKESLCCYELTDNISTVARKMRDFGFELCNRTTLINLLHVKLIKNYKVYLVNDEVLPLSQKRSPVLRQKYACKVPGNLVK